MAKLISVFLCFKLTWNYLVKYLTYRAFVWMKIEEFEKAQIDLLWVIKMSNYPKESFYKIYQRLGIVLQKLQKTRFQTLYFLKNLYVFKSFLDPCTPKPCTISSTPFQVCFGIFIMLLLVQSHFEITNFSKHFEII